MTETLDILVHWFLDRSIAVDVTTGSRAMQGTPGAPTHLNDPL